MARSYYLRIGSDSVEQAEHHATKASAVESYRRCAEELDRYGQAIEASIHIAANRSEVVEYPDYALSLGPRGGVKVERC